MVVTPYTGIVVVVRRRVCGVEGINAFGNDDYEGGTD